MLKTSLDPEINIKNIRLSVIVPCFNEEDVLNELYNRVTVACKNFVADSYEFILVNDGSYDGTWRLIQDLSSKDGRVVGVNLSRNFGHQIAITAGIQVSLGERLFILDADLQDPPELLGSMMRLMDENYEVVYGLRSIRKGESALKKVSCYFFYRLLSKIIEIDIPLDTGDFRLITRRVANHLIQMPESHRFIRGMISWVGFRQVALPYDRDPRYAGVTKYPFTMLLRLALDAITGFSVLPLRIASLVGLSVAGLGFVFSIYLVLLYFMRGIALEGWTSLAVLVLMLGGIQLLVIGIIGEYLGRLYMQSKGRPIFIIQDLIKGNDE